MENAIQIQIDSDPNRNIESRIPLKLNPDASVLFSTERLHYISHFNNKKNRF